MIRFNLFYDDDSDTYRGRCPKYPFIEADDSEDPGDALELIQDAVEYYLESEGVEND